MEKLQKEFARDVIFLFVYTREAHPDDGPEKRQPGATGGWRMKNNAVKINNHKTFDDRVKAAKDLKAAGKQKWQVLVDDMKDSAWTHWGKLPNSAFLIAPSGRIAGKWAWVSADPIRAELSKQKSLAAWTVADDPLLPLRDCTDGEWLKYDAAGKPEEARFEKCSQSLVTRRTGEQAETLTLKLVTPPKTPAKPVRKDLKVGEVTLPCVVVTQDSVETWYSTRLPGDGIAKVVEKTDKGDVVRRVITDAGFKTGESCLKAYDPTKK